MATVHPLRTTAYVISVAERPVSGTTKKLQASLKEQIIDA
jgi:hypothetical protein